MLRQIPCAGAGSGPQRKTSSHTSDLSLQKSSDIRLLSHVVDGVTDIRLLSHIVDGVLQNSQRVE